jgi:nitrite reductase (NADH) large subunit
MKRYVIVGGNVAGVTAARELRKLDETAAVEIYTNEADPYYYRPRLWEYIAGKCAPEDTYFRPVEWYAQEGIGLQLNTTVEKLDAHTKTLTLANGDTVAYDRLLITTGSRCFVPPVQGADLPNVFSLRNMEDAKAIVACAQTARKAVLIGGGLLGLETAKALADRGLQVTVVEFFPTLLPRQLDPAGAAVLSAHLEGLGLSLLTDQVTETIEQTPDGLRVLLKSGLKLDTEMVIFSTGIRSNIAPWQAAGVAANRGLLVNEYLETNLPDIFAAGDVAEFAGIVYGIIPAAREQAQFAAANMAADHSQAYPGTLVSTRLKIAGLEFNAFGDSTLDGEGVTVLRLSLPEEGRYERLAIQDGKVAGVIVLGENKRVMALKKLIAEGAAIDALRAQLQADGFDLTGL